MTHIAIVFHSGYGHTRKQAEAVHAGAASVAGVQARLLQIDAEGNLPEAAFSGLMAQSPSDASPEEGPLPGDLETARRFGVRVAGTARSIMEGRETVAA